MAAITVYDCETRDNLMKKASGISGLISMFLLMVCQSEGFGGWWTTQ